MLDLSTGLVLACGFGATLLLAFVTWLCSLPLRDVSIVDRVWSVLITAAALVYLVLAQPLPPSPSRAQLAFVLLLVWALRLTWHITQRNWGKPEDQRYQDIRKRNQPYFEFKSLYLVFALQAGLAWLVAMPLFATGFSTTPLFWLDYAGMALAIFGIVFEAVADWQLSQFGRNKTSKDQVMDTGLWSLSRHPNYFGEVCTWWGLYLLALAGGGWWSVVSPAFMTFTLLKVSGVNLLEKGIAERRPKYKDYVERVNAFIPGPQRQPRSGASQNGKP